MRRKAFFMVISVIMAFICAIGLTACGPDKQQPGSNPGETHMHTYSEKWSFDSEYHWRSAICEHVDQTIDEGLHEFNEANKCIICGYTLPTEDVRCFTYTLNEDKNSYTLSKAPTDIAEVDIPNTYEGLLVTKIGYRAFANNSNLSSVVLPDSIEEIGAYAFYDCGSLRNINIPSSVQKVGNDAFFGCDSLSYTVEDNLQYLGNEFNQHFLLMGMEDTHVSSVTIKEETRIIYSSIFLFVSDYIETINYMGTLADWCGITFMNKYANPLYAKGDFYVDGTLITELTIPLGVTAIPDYAFVDFMGTSVHIPQSVISIGKSAFENCYLLTSVELPTTLKEISDSAFVGCYSLEVISLPSSLQKFGDNVFDNCIKLQYTELDSMIYLGNAENQYLVLIGCNDDERETIELKENTKFIANDAFDGLTVLESITLSSALLSIGAGAFSDTQQLNNVYFNGTIEEWCMIAVSDEYAAPMYQGEVLYINDEIPYGDIVLSDSVTSIQPYAFKNTRISSITLPNVLTEIPSYLFDNCTNLVIVNFNDTISYIAAYAFYGCRSLKYIDISNVLKIGSSAFYGCTSLSDIVFSEKLQRIDGSAFEKCSAITSVSVPNSVTALGSGAFFDCTGLESVQLGNGIENIPSYLFSNCELLSTINIPKTVTSIGSHAFAGCSSLTELKIPEAVTSIGEYTFSDCAAQILWAEQTKLNAIGDNVFAGYVGKMLTLPDSVQALGNSVFRDSKLETISLENITVCGESTFEDCENLFSVVLSQALSSIPDKMFKGCSSLTNLNITGALTIGEEAFSECISLETIELSDNLFEIGARAFENISAEIHWGDYPVIQRINVNAFESYKGETLSIPNSVTYIGKYALKNCASEIIWGENPQITEIWEYAFAEYQGANLSIPDSVTELRDGVFKDCINLTSFSVPEGVTYLSNYIFSGCKALTEIILPSTMESFSNHAFSGCISLASIDLPEGFKHLGHSNFNGCSSITEIIVPDGANLSIGSLYGMLSLEKIVLSHLGTEYGDITLQQVFTNSSDVGSIPSSLKEVTIKSGSLQYDAFANASSIVKVTLPKGLTELPGGCFSGCSSLTEINIPETVTKLGLSAFNGCTSLKEILLPQALITIENEAFIDCSNLTTITFQGTMDQWKVITKDYNWNYNTGNYTIHCTDGDIAKS